MNTMLEIEKPRIECIERSQDESYAKFVFEPLVPGYAVALGNSLKRILLTHLDGSAGSCAKIFPPIYKVDFFVEDNRVGQISDYDRLILEVWSNGSISPEEAISLASEILINHLRSFTETRDKINYEIMEKDKSKDKILNMLIEGLHLSVRSYNCLRRAGIKTVEDLTKMTEEDLRRMRNLGSKSFNEVKKKINDLDLEFRLTAD